MAAHKKYAYIISLLLLLVNKSQGQSPFFNLNINNGLPSNHVYNATVDHLGYLWITTPKGIVKFNGYNCKTFNSSDGLPNEDVWYLMEDKVGRLWMGCVASEIGYLYENKYHSINLDTNSNAVYPLNFAWFQNGVAFSTSYTNGSAVPTLYVYSEDQLRKINLSDNLFKKYTKLGKKNPFNTLPEVHWANFATYSRDSILHTVIDDELYNLRLNKDLTAEIKSVIPFKNGVSVLNENQRLIAGDYYILKSITPLNSFTVFNMNTGETQVVKLSDYGVDENILFCHYNIKRGDPDTTVFFFTKSYVTEVVSSNKFYISKIFKFNSIIDNNNLNGENIITFNRDSLWSILMATKRDGLVIRTAFDTIYKPLSNRLEDYKFIGSIDDLTSFWWNSTTSTLMTLCNGKLNKIKLNVHGTFTNILKYKKDTLVLLGGTGGTTFIRKSEKVKLELTIPKSKGTIHILDAKKLNPDSIIFVSSSGFGIKSIRDENKYNILTSDRLSNLSANLKHTEYWAYNGFKAVKYDAATKKIRCFDKKYIESAGIKKIEQILFDTFGNMIVRSPNHVWIFDSTLSNGRILNGLENINLTNSSACIYRDKLLIIGKIGVVVIAIKGKNSFASPTMFLNNKLFNQITNAHVCNNELLLATDKEYYKVGLSDQNLAEAQPISILQKMHRLILNTGNNSFQYHFNDTLFIPINTKNLQLDLINPLGSGSIVFNVAIDSGDFTPLTTNEYSLSQLEPDHYYTIRIKASDEIWNSPVHTFVLYKNPEWFQKQIIKKIIVVSIVAGLLLLLALSALITRKLVLNANKKRNARMELELKSIYAQINPHFIFNSLNSALLLVSKNKTEDAYTHISKFSRLLRSYIKSSRNKFIVLADEIKNLTNYIDLQQVRFKDKFNYKIQVAENVDINTISIPSLLLQPFVENAIEHGLLNKEETGNLEIRFEQDKNGKHLLCIIEDDGIGRKESKLNKIPNPVKDESYGELLIKDLVNIFNKYEHMNIHVSYKDKTYPQTGTVVTIQINLTDNKVIR